MHHISTRQYARIVKAWVTAIGLDPALYGTHTLRRTNASLIYRRTKNLRAVQLLLGHTKRAMRLPVRCPYEEIYKSDKWWGLVPDNNNRLLDPAGVVAAHQAKQSKWSGIGDEPPSLRSRFFEVIDGVKAFHGDIEEKYHSETFVHYAAESKSSKLYTWGTIEWGQKI